MLRDDIWLLASVLFWVPPPGTDTHWAWRHPEFPSWDRPGGLRRWAAVSTGLRHPRNEEDVTCPANNFKYSDRGQMIRRHPEDFYNQRKGTYNARCASSCVFLFLLVLQRSITLTHNALPNVFGCPPLFPSLPFYEAGHSRQDGSAWGSDLWVFSAGDNCDCHRCCVNKVQLKNTKSNFKESKSLILIFYCTYRFLSYNVHLWFIGVFLFVFLNRALRNKKNEFDCWQKIGQTHQQ